MTLIDQVRAAGAEEALAAFGLSHCKGASKVGSSTEDWWLEIGAIGTEANDALAEVIVLGIAGRIRAGRVRCQTSPEPDSMIVIVPEYSALIPSATPQDEVGIAAALALIKADYERKATDG